jgi:hypothetical protein
MKDSHDQQQRDEIYLLCKELDSLGGGIKTRLESIRVHQGGGDALAESSLIETDVLRYIDMFYNCAIITYGPQNSGKSKCLFQASTGLLEIVVSRLFAKLNSEEEEESHSRVFLEAYEYFIDPKSNTERKMQVLRLPNYNGKTHPFA